MAVRALTSVLIVVLAISSTYGQGLLKKKDKTPPISVKQLTVAEYNVFTVSCTYPQRIVIQSASYGMNERRADVSSQVNDFCEGASFCRFKVTNDHPFDQDPYPNVGKELKVKYYCYGPLERSPQQARPSGIAVQEFQQFEDPCKAVGMPMQILDAFYGYGKAMMDVTPLLKQYCQNSCSFVVSNGQPINNDPAYNQRKVLQVSFTCGGDEDSDKKRQLTA